MSDIENLLSELVLRVRRHFSTGTIDAIEMVSQSRIANELCENGVPANCDVDRLSESLFADIARGE